MEDEERKTNTEEIECRLCNCLIESNPFKLCKKCFKRLSDAIIEEDKELLDMLK